MKIKNGGLVAEMKRIKTMIEEIMIEVVLSIVEKDIIMSEIEDH